MICEVNGSSKSRELELSGLAPVITAYCVVTTLMEVASSQTQKLASQMGLKKRVRLKVDAVPTIFVRHSHSCSQSEPGPNTSRKRTSSHLSSSDSAATKRKAFEKRERQRVSACSYWYRVSIIYSNNSSLVIYLALTGVSGRVLVCTF